MKQSVHFLQGEGAAWFERNKNKLPPKDDPVIDLIRKAGIAPHNMLEIGCGNGWRLSIAQSLWNCDVRGIDPGADKQWPFHKNWVSKGTADNLLFHKGSFDLVIYGFCLYLCDRDDLFKIVAEGDRVLADGGYIVIHDFFPLYPHKVKYKHKEGLFSYKMNYANLWLANPAYSMCGISTSDPVDEAGVIIINKDIQKAWPLSND